jgi:UDP-glucose 4-epimerase
MPDISGSSVLITGGSGLVGSHTMDRLLKEDVDRIVIFDKFINRANLSQVMTSDRVKIIQGDMADPSAVEAALQGIDFVFHFAGLLLLPSKENPVACLSENINGMFHLLDLMIKHQVKRLVYSSSVTIYGSSKEKVIMDEDYPFRNRTMYGAGKIVGEQFCRVFNEMHGLNYIALRYSSVYGPRQHYQGLYPRLIMQSLDRMAQGKPPQIPGSGEEVQDFVYVGDVAEANLLAMTSEEGDLALNIASGRPTSVKELIEVLIDVFSPGMETEYLPATGQSIVPYRWFAVDRAKEVLNWSPQTDLRTGLQKLIDWQRQQES